MSVAGLSIEPLTQRPQWIRKIATWFYTEWPDLYLAQTPEELASQLREGACDGGRDLAWGALLDGELVGAVVLRMRADDDGEPAPWLAAVYVAPAWRRRGVGKALVRFAEAQAGDAPWLYLYTRDRERFYLSLGWQVSERTQAPGGEAVVMRRRLGADPL